MTSTIKGTLGQAVKSADECERRGGKTLWNTAIIPFIPEEIDAELGKNEYLELTLNVSVSRNTSSSSARQQNLIKKKMKIFNHGSVEELFEWRRGVCDIIARKPCPTARSKFDMV